MVQVSPVTTRYSLVTLLREYAYSANLTWLKSFFFFFCEKISHLSKSLDTKLQICFAKTLLFTLGINNACLINLLLL